MPRKAQGNRRVPLHHSFPLQPFLSQPLWSRGESQSLFTLGTSPSGSRVVVIPASRMRKLSLRVSVDEDPGGQEREDRRRRGERLRPGTLPPPPGAGAPAQRACALQGQPLADVALAPCPQAPALGDGHPREGQIPRSAGLSWGAASRWIFTIPFSRLFLTFP